MGYRYGRSGCQYGIWSDDMGSDYFQALSPGALNTDFNTCTNTPWRSSLSAPSARGLHSFTFQLNLSRA